MKKLLSILLVAMMLVLPVMSLAEDVNDNTDGAKFANILVICAILLFVLALLIAITLYLGMKNKHHKCMEKRKDLFKEIIMKEKTEHNRKNESPVEKTPSEEKLPPEELSSSDASNNRKNESQVEKTPSEEKLPSEELSLSDASKFELLAERNYTYIMNYYIYQIIGKVCEILSIIFSVISLCLSLVNDSSTQSLSHYGRLPIALFSIAFIIVVVYLAPSKRMAEQLDAWRETDNTINQILVGESNSSCISCIPDVLKKCENMLSTDKS